MGKSRGKYKGKGFDEERQLAIEMWMKIRAIIEENPRVEKSGIYDIKREFCIEHNCNWFEYCYFCQHCSSCNKCPLLKKTSGFYHKIRFKNNEMLCLDYCIACNQSANKALPQYRDDDGNIKIEERLNACDRIIQALRDFKEEADNA